MAPVALGFVKFTLFLFYFQLFKPLRWVRTAIYVGAPMEGAFYGATAIAQFVRASPRPGESWKEFELSPRVHGGEKLSVPISAVGLFIDIVLFLLPIPAVLQLQMQKKRKIRLLLLFGVGIL